MWWRRWGIVEVGVFESELELEVRLPSRRLPSGGYGSEVVDAMSNRVYYD